MTYFWKKENRVLGKSTSRVNLSTSQVETYPLWLVESEGDYVEQEYNNIDAINVDIRRIVGNYSLFVPEAHAELNMTVCINN